MNEYVVGIDIGSSKICAAVGKVNRQGKLQIIGITSVPCNGLKKAVVVDIDHTADAIKQCIEQLEKMIDIPITEAYISLPGGICELVRNNGVIAVSSEDREIQKNDVERVIEAAKLISVPVDKEIIGVEPEQFIIDGYDQIKDPIGMSGMKLEVQAQIIMAQSTIVNNLYKSVKRTGLHVKGIVLQPLAISNTVLRKEEKEMGVALVDVGAETIDVSIFKEGKLRCTYIIPLGGENITNDISMCLKVPHSEAERLKIKYGSIVKEPEMEKEKIKVKASYNDITVVDYSMLVEVIQARVEELLYLVGKTLAQEGYYEEISGVVIVGGGISLFRGISELSREILKKSVRVGSPEYVGAASPIYVTAVGIIEEAASTLKMSRALTEEVDEYSFNKSKVKKSNVKEKKTVTSKIKEFLADFF